MNTDNSVVTERVGEGKWVKVQECIRETNGDGKNN